MNSISINNAPYFLSDVTKGVLTIGTTAGLYYFAKNRKITIEDIVPYTVATGAVVAAGGAVTTISSLLLYTVTKAPNNLTYTAKVGVAATVGGVATIVTSITCFLAYIGAGAISAMRR